MSKHILYWRNPFIFIFLAAVFTYACKKENKQMPGTNYYYQYYPLKVGDYRILSLS